MSVKVLARVLGHFHPDSDVGDRLVLIVLSDAAHDDGITWVSQEDMANRSQLSERHVRRCLKEMGLRGEIEIRKAQRGRRRLNVYRVMAAPCEPDYDRLPFELDEPFSRPDTMSGGHGMDYRTSEPERPDIRRVDDRTSGADVSPIHAHVNERTVSKPSRDPSLPAAVDRIRVTGPEGALALLILSSWNAQTGQRLAAKEWLSKIIMRIREHPDLDLPAHANVIAAALADPWWRGSPSPSVVYGNGAQFEKCLTHATANPGDAGFAERGMTPEEMERYGT